MNNVLSKNRENLLFYFACFGVLAIASVYAVIAPAHMDELSSLALYSHDWRGIFIRHEPNNHALTTLWGAFSGQNLIVARMVSVLSLLSIIIILARTYGRLYTIGCMSIMTLLPAFLYYAGNFRGYMLQTLLILSIFAYLWHHKERIVSRHWFVIHGLFAIATFHIPTTLYVWLPFLVTEGLVAYRLKEISVHLAPVMIGGGLYVVLTLLSAAVTGAKSLNLIQSADLQVLAGVFIEHWSQVVNEGVRQIFFNEHVSKGLDYAQVTGQFTSVYYVYLPLLLINTYFAFSLYQRKKQPWLLCLATFSVLSVLIFMGINKNPFYRNMLPLLMIHGAFSLLLLKETCTVRAFHQIMLGLAGVAMISLSWTHLGYRHFVENSKIQSVIDGMEELYKQDPTWCQRDVGTQNEIKMPQLWLSKTICHQKYSLFELSPFTGRPLDGHQYLIVGNDFDRSTLSLDYVEISKNEKITILEHVPDVG